MYLNELAQFRQLSAKDIADAEASESVLALILTGANAEALQAPKGNGALHRALAAIGLRLRNDTIIENELVSNGSGTTFVALADADLGAPIVMQLARKPEGTFTLITVGEAGMIRSKPNAANGCVKVAVAPANGRGYAHVAYVGGIPLFEDYSNRSKLAVMKEGLLGPIKTAAAQAIRVTLQAVEGFKRMDKASCEAATRGMAATIAVMRAVHDDAGSLVDVVAKAAPLGTLHGAMEDAMARTPAMFHKAENAQPAAKAIGRVIQEGIAVASATVKRVDGLDFVTLKRVFGDRILPSLLSQPIKLGKIEGGRKRLELRVYESLGDAKGEVHDAIVSKANAFVTKGPIADDPWYNANAALEDGTVVQIPILEGLTATGIVGTAVEIATMLGADPVVRIEEAAGRVLLCVSAAKRGFFDALSLISVAGGYAATGRIPQLLLAAFQQAEVISGLAAPPFWVRERTQRRSDLVLIAGRKGSELLQALADTKVRLEQQPPEKPKELSQEELDMADVLMALPRDHVATGPTWTPTPERTGPTDAAGAGGDDATGQHTGAEADKPNAEGAPEGESEDDERMPDVPGLIPDGLGAPPSAEYADDSGHDLELGVGLGAGRLADMFGECRDGPTGTGGRGVLRLAGLDRTEGKFKLANVMRSLRPAWLPKRAPMNIMRLGSSNSSQKAKRGGDGKPSGEPVGSPPSAEQDDDMEVDGGTCEAEGDVAADHRGGRPGGRPADAVALRETTERRVTRSSELSRMAKGAAGADTDSGAGEAGAGPPGGLEEAAIAPHNQATGQGQNFRSRRGCLYRRR